MTEVVGAVLVGGASSRMGTDKALLPLDGTAMAHRVAAALVAGGAGAIELIGRDPALGRALDLHDLVDGWGTRDDRWKGIGPLGGLATAVLEARPAHGSADPARAGDDVIVVVAACDQPNLTGPLVRRLVDALLAAPSTIGAAAAITADGRRHPLPSAWRASAGPALVALIDGGARRADAGFGAVGVIDVAADDEVLIDLDTPDDVHRWLDGRRPPAERAPE
ncbi:molybdenum cofactor guanylyltransferase [Aquihabitans sp. McL0605]|uniref:molybdenum cofactor guanylyltransferase n=1 Tax=Aquihabitans sp. McL0605 TaxID=3415671 RepID=UPI003CF277A4